MTFVAFMGLGCLAAGIYLGVSGHIVIAILAILVGWSILEGLREQWPKGD